LPTIIAWLYITVGNEKSMKNGLS